MRTSEVSSRYATALYTLASETGSQDKVFAELRAVKKLIDKDEAIADFFHSPLVKSADKETALKEAFNGKGLSTETESFLLLLAKKNRLEIFEDVVESFQTRADKDHGVTRGEVTTTTVLSTAERKDVEKFVSEATGKKVILTYSEDPEMIGGLIAKVGSYTFDDTLASHLRRLKEDLKRRTH